MRRRAIGLPERMVFCFEKQRTVINAANLHKRAKELNGIQIITPLDLENLEVFARKHR